MAANTQARAPMKQRLAHMMMMTVLTGCLTASLQPNSGWVTLAFSLAGGLAYFLLEPLIKPRRPLRDPVREESIAVAEVAIRLAEAETHAHGTNK